MVVGSAFNATAGEPALQLFENGKYLPMQWSEIEEIDFNTESATMRIIDVDGNEVNLPYAEPFSYPSGCPVPLIEITTDVYLKEIPDKVNYKSGSFSLHGFGNYEDVVKDVNIRGRGNTSWSFEKKPYRLKFDKKISLCGLPSAKNYVLLANYTDSSHAQNALAFYIGQMLGLPYTNTAVPVEVTLNGIYKGLYVLTNKPGINAGSVDIDEKISIMWEMDDYFDEEYRFRSPRLNLPVMVVDPDMDEETFLKWKEDFIEMESAAIKKAASPLVDMDNFARYLLVYDIMGNWEIGYPKSVKLYKTEGEKYKFGPIWDFDVCMGYNWQEHIGYDFSATTDSGWVNSLFRYLQQDPEAIAARKKAWDEIKDKLPELLEFIDDYAARIKTATDRNKETYEFYKDFDTTLANMKTWLTLRFDYLTSTIK